MVHLRKVSGKCKYSSKAQHFAPNWSFISNAKKLRQPITSDVTNDVGAPTVYCRIYWRKFLTLSNQTSRYNCKCIRISVCLRLLVLLHRIDRWPSVGKVLSYWFSMCCFSLYCLNCLCSFSVWCLGQNVEFDCMSHDMTKPTKWLCTQRRLRSAWAVKTLIRLGGCPGWSESSLCAHSFCWFCHVAARISTGSLSFIYSLLTCRKREKNKIWHHCQAWKHRLVRGYTFSCIWAASWQNQQNDCAPSEDSDQPGHPPSLISLRCALIG